jgi:pimeloyl-ACP methyl ester carboxylesterase
MGTEMHVTHWGTEGPLIVMVHGSAQGSKVGGDRHFARQERLVEHGWQIVVPDRPGHGRSPSPGRPDDAEADGPLVAELLGDGAHLVGHSFGACVALAAAHLRPHAVRSLTLIEPAMMPLAIDTAPVQEFLGKLSECMRMASSPADAATAFARLIRIPDEIRGGSDPVELDRMGKALSQLKVPTPQQLGEQLATVRAAGIPLMVVEGGWNPAFGAVSDRVAERGGGIHVVIPSEHHFPQLVSDDFNKRLRDFMTAADQRAAGRA